MLPLSERLRSSHQIRQVFAEGRSFVDALMVLHLLRLEAGDPTRAVCFTVGKKVGNAVIRNRVRRRMRAIYGGLLGQLPPGFHAVFVARSRASEASSDVLAVTMVRLLRRAELLSEVAEG